MIRHAALGNLNGINRVGDETMHDQTIRAGWLGRLVPVALTLVVVGAALALALSS